MKVSKVTAEYRILGALMFALLVACLMSFGRGGFDTQPFIVFTVAGFIGALAWQFLFRRDTLCWFERALRLLPFHSLIRFGVVFAGLVCLVIWAGPIIATGGFGGWILWLIACLLAPAVICPLAPRYPILFGIIAEACILFSSAVDDSRLYAKSREIQWSHVTDDISSFLIAWGIASALSLIISIPIHMQRRVA